MDYVSHYNKNLNNINKRLRENVIQPSISFYKPTLLQHFTLRMDLFRCDKILKKYKHIHSLPWKVYFLDSSLQIENNYPHTHKDVIFLNDTFFSKHKSNRINILIHEKIHVYQRYFPIPYNNILLTIYKLIPKQLISTHPDFEKYRQNPDNNNILYTDNNQYTLPIFKDSPKSIQDVEFKKYNKHNKDTNYSKIDTNEHPNESFAYFLTSSILNKNVDTQLIPFL